MDIEEVREYTLSLAGVTEDQPFGPDNITFRVEGKIFLCLWLGEEGMARADKPPHFALKMKPERGEEIREKYEAVTPAWHWNKRHWSDVAYEMIDDDVVRAWIREAHSLIVASLPKYKRAAYQQSI